MSALPSSSSQKPVGLMLISLFALTIFSSAYLLFQVQPLISKHILPWFGGSPTVWTTAMLFFQCVLFGGYAYAHIVSKHGSPRAQIWIHLLLLVSASAMAVFVLPGESMKPTGNEEPIAKILLLLGVSVGLPYFVLATTGPLLQYWFTRTGGGASVFRLYALSNAGSFIALLSFPYFFEPLFELPQLGRFWTFGFWLFAVLCGSVVLLSRRYVKAQQIVARPTAPALPELFFEPSLKQRLLWIGLPALASLAFIATTDHVSHDIAPEPRLWIATLSLYLLTFILSFDHPRWYQRKWIAALVLISLVLLSGRNEIPEWFNLEWDYSLSEVRWTYLASMFLVCFMSHGELYRLRPTNPRYLTEFYLWMSFGGACGGLFVALVATNFFSDYHEWPLYHVATIVLASKIIVSVKEKGGHFSWILALATAVLVLFLMDPLHWRVDSNPEYTDIRLHQSRNFYGTITVKERRYPLRPDENYRVFYSGQITHGVQYLDPTKRRFPISYYGPEGGMFETIRYAQSHQQHMRVAIIGLGAGTLATYAREPDHYDFYEINPNAVEVADRWFDNVSASLARTKRVIIGDARLKMEQLGDDDLYDIIVMDAFTGGSVPIHLLTREAFLTYRRHLKPDGFIIINITNGYLNLYPVVKLQAETLKMGFRHKFQPSDPDSHIRKNMIFILTNDREYLKKYPSVNRKHFNDQGVLMREEDPNIPDVPLWTDHFSSLSPIELKD